MKTEEIVRLTREAVANLLRDRKELVSPFPGHERRRSLRWPFPGAVEVWPAGGDGAEHWLGVCHNLSDEGLGFSCEYCFKPGTPVEIAFHLPEASFYGQAMIRHVMETPRGFMIGVQFVFED